MKKLLTLVSAVAVAGLFSTASASDRSGKWAIGYQDQFNLGADDTAVNGGLISAGEAGAWSVKYGLKSNVTIQGLFGFNTGKPLNDTLTIGARGLYDIVENENSQFYIGGGVLFNTIDDGNKALRINVPVGFEFNVASLPEIAFSIEGGLNYDIALDVGGDPDLSDISGISTASSTVGGDLRLGVHYYF